MVGGKICCHMELVFAIMYLSPAKNSQLTMTYFNAQSVCQRAGEICDFIVDNKLDALILTETWLQEVGDEPCVKEMTPPDYVFHPVLDVGVVVSLSL